MQSSGSGLTFTDQDIKSAQVVIGLLSRATFKNLDCGSLIEGALALKWMEEFVKSAKDNVLDYSTAKMVEPAQAADSVPEVKTKGRSRK